MSQGPNHTLLDHKVDQPFHVCFTLYTGNYLTFWQKLIYKTIYVVYKQGLKITKFCPKTTAVSPHGNRTWYLRLVVTRGHHTCSSHMVVTKSIIEVSVIMAS